MRRPSNAAIGQSPEAATASTGQRSTKILVPKAYCAGRPRRPGHNPVEQREKPPPSASRLAEQHERIGDEVPDMLDALEDFRQAHDVGDAAVEEAPGLGEPVRAVVEPIEHGRAVDGGEQRALAIEAEIGGAVADPEPDRIDGAV